MQDAPTLAKRILELEEENGILRAKRFSELLDDIVIHIKDLRECGEIHSDWKTLPRVSENIGGRWNMVPSQTSGVAYRDAWFALIEGYGVDGLRYMRVVQVNGRQYEDGAHEVQLLRELRSVRRNSPAFCTVTPDGGDLPIYDRQARLPEEVPGKVS